MIPKWYLLFPYLFFVALATLLLVFNLYHVAKYGLQSTKTSIVLAIYILSFFIVAIFSVTLLFTHDWSGALDVGEFLHINFGGSYIFDL